MRYLFLFLALAMIMACAKDPASNLKPLNLLKYGMPITVLAPDSAEVKTMDMGFVKDVAISDGDRFSVQIFSSQALTTDITKIKAEKLAEVKAIPFFSKVVREEDNGFVYEMALDSTQQNYGFRYFKVMGDQEFTFQTGLLGIFTLEEAELMYSAVQPQKKE